jgi:hypothetical protein
MCHIEGGKRADLADFHHRAACILPLFCWQESQLFVNDLLPISSGVLFFTESTLKTEVCLKTILQR